MDDSPFPRRTSSSGLGKRSFGSSSSCRMARGFWLYTIGTFCVAVCKGVIRANIKNTCYQIMCWQFRVCMAESGDPPPPIREECRLLVEQASAEKPVLSHHLKFHSSTSSMSMCPADGTWHPRIKDSIWLNRSKTAIHWWWNLNRLPQLWFQSLLLMLII